MAFDPAQSAGHSVGQGSTSCSLTASQQLSNLIIGQSCVPNLDGPAWGVPDPHLAVWPLGRKGPVSCQYVVTRCNHFPTPHPSCSSLLAFLDLQGTSNPHFLFITGERDRASRPTTYNAALRTRRRGPVAARRYDVERRPFNDHFHSAIELCNSHRPLPDLAGNRQVLLRAGPA